MSIRLTNISHIDTLWHIEQTHVQTPWTKTKLASCLQHEDYQAWLWQCDNQVVAYGLANIIHNESHLMQITVLAMLQRRGYGKALLQDILQQLKQRAVNSFILEVRIDNISAIALYEALEFKKIGHRKRYYCIQGKCYDAYVYRWRG